ncbi:hypothetical protein IHV09_03085 [Fictibacillus sp. 23RED33]|uniref:DUF1796 family putative cysteine peptidase n=1 Tax=Fictibacillus sp. 23RED33 TaxID=2745879 RepID=UPI0018CF9904|nr:DUF1796 family putative cysteine peptidase [Fictibacillus sp. 23RED33]MBH0172522.1 hypothetical protein [Fictibacillus sp. 23RED33]
MRLQDIKKPYDAVISLGSECGPGIHLRRHFLRKVAFPFDWVCSHSLAGINELLRTRFKRYMKFRNMEKIHTYKPGYVLDDQGVTTGSHSHFIKDHKYNVISVHDFPIIPEQHWILNYLNFRRTIKQRVQRMYEWFRKSSSLLFIRWSVIDIDEEQLKKETAELEMVLSTCVKGDFNILMIYPTDKVGQLTEVNWGMKHVCVIYVPVKIDPITHNDTWDLLLNGISIKY